MKNKIRNFIYQNDANYTSYGSIKCLFVCVFLFLSLVVGVFPVVAGLWWGLSILIAIDFAFLLYIFILKHLKKTYKLRFLSEGIIDALLSSLFLASAYIILFVTECDTPALTYGVLLSYLIFVTLFVIFIIHISQSDKGQVSKKSVQNKYLIFIGSCIPISGTIGILIGKIIFKTFEFGNQVAVYVFFGIFVFISLIFSLGYANFVKYFYCVKYKIDCDECGNATSPELENTKT